jgi:hypothetical protein
MHGEKKSDRQTLTVGSMTSWQNSKKSTLFLNPIKEFF